MHNMQAMEDKGKAKEVQCSKKLNLNLPLLSTKRHYYGQILEEEPWCSKFQGPRDERIPFSWEQAPGKPKNLGKRINEEDGVGVQSVETTPRRPRPPPCRWHCGVENVVEERLPKQDQEINILCSDEEDYGILDHTISCCDDDMGEEDEEGDNNFTNADMPMDVFSLSEAIDILERTRKVDEGVNNMDMKINCCNDFLRSRVLESRGVPSPSFIINRFLPDASAIAAASSALSLAKSNKQQRGIIMSNNPSCCSSSSNKSSSKPKSKKVCDIRAVTRPSQDSPKGCGIMDNLLPWSWGLRMKHRLRVCGIKSPVMIMQPQRPSHLHLHPTQHAAPLTEN